MKSSSVAAWADRHARSILFLLGALVAAGVMAGRSMPVSLFPRVNYPRIRVNIEAGERPAERMAMEVTRPMEEALREIPGVRSVFARSGRGSSEISLTFDWGEDMLSARLQADAQANKLLPTLPPGTTVSVRQMDPTLFSTISYSLVSDTRSPNELRDLAELQIRPILSAVSGVARIFVHGGSIEEYRVTIDPARLAALGVGIDDVSAALTAANVQTAVGQMEDHDKLYLIVTDTRFKSLDQVGETVVRSGASGVVRLADVATIRRDAEPQFTLDTADGHNAVLIDVYQQPGANTVEIAQQIQIALQGEQQRLPDVHITKWYDQSDLINSSAHSVRDSVVIGVILAGVVLLLFLRNWRITLVAALTVPVVLAVASLLLRLVGQSFNMMTLGGMAAAVGLIIDDAIVMCEHIVRRVHARATVLQAADEFRKPLIGSSLSTIVIHIPPAFMVGFAGAFFAALSLAMASCLVISFFVAWLAIPILANRFIRQREVEGLAHAPESSHSRYGRMMDVILGRPWMVTLIVLPLLLVGYLCYRHLESDFMPSMDEGGFIIDYRTKPGMSLAESDRLLRQVESILHHTPEVKTFTRRTGFGMGGDFSEPDSGDFFVLLNPYPRRDIHEVMDDVEKEIRKTEPFEKIEPAQLMEDVIGDITGRPQDVVVNLFSEDEKLLYETAEKTAEALKKIEGLKDIDDGIIPAGDSLVIDVDRVKASLEGVNPDSITKNLDELLSGDVTTQVQQGDKLVNVRVWIPKRLRQTTRDVENLQLRAPDGHLFPLKRIAALHTITGEPEITREDLKRVVQVSARSDRDLGSTIADVRRLLDSSDFLPKGVRYTLGGMYEQQQIAFRGLVIVMVAGAVLVFLLLLFLYESFRVGIAILMTTLLSMGVVFMGLWVTGTALNVSSLMGMVMIVGNVTEVAIFFYSEYADFPHEGDVRDRLIAAGSYRMRAITMTTLAAILALLPLALGLGQGSAMLKPLAIAIIAGLIAQLPLVLVVLPGILLLLGLGRKQTVYEPIPVEGGFHESSH